MDEPACCNAMKHSDPNPTDDDAGATKLMLTSKLSLQVRRVLHPQFYQYIFPIFLLIINKFLTTLF